jgi:hypothetical protein
METTNNGMTAERSLEIIARSIEESRNTMSRQMAKPLMLWGALVTGTALIVGHLWEHNGGPRWNFLWFAMTIVGFFLNYWLDRQQHVRATGIVPTLMGNVWLTFCALALGIAIILPIVAHIVPPAHGYLPLTGVLALLMGMATAISGCIIKNKLITCCGIVAGLACFILDFYVDGGYEMLIIAAMGVLGLLLPGVYLYLKFNNQ